ncbi:MAG: tRNA(His) guanylyltransferase Thg1 family protein [Myxococcota bacterium]
MKDELGDRMKEYELAEAGRRLMARLPVCARIDGKRFSRFTEGLPRPYDERLSRLMVDTTRYLVTESAARAGYTQSDEISLLWYPDEPKGQVFLDGRIQKLTSILASMATAFFNAELPTRIPEKAGTLALFDCRVWAVPTKEEAANVFLWRELDATKNSLSMAARAYYPHEEITNRKSAALHELLHQKGINWNDYPAFFKRGTFILRRRTSRKFTADELTALPPGHSAHRDPELVVTRTEITPVELPPFAKVLNRVGVLFDGEEPRTAAT